MQKNFTIYLQIRCQLTISQTNNNIIIHYNPNKNIVKILWDFIVFLNLLSNLLGLKSLNNFTNLAHLINERYLRPWAMYESTTALFTIYMATEFRLRQG